MFCFEFYGTARKQFKLRICEEFRKDSSCENSTSCSDCFNSKNNFEECSVHKVTFTSPECSKCIDLKKMVNEFQHHNHTFTCQKKKVPLNIKKAEGHGRLDGLKEGCPISNNLQCRFNFPQFQINRTTFIFGMPKDLEDSERKQRKEDLKKIRKFLVRQTFSENGSINEATKEMEKWTFLKFLYEVGMFECDKSLENYSDSEKHNALKRYLNALSASVRGTGTVLIKRKVKDLFTNNFNRRLLGVHKANHDIQIVIDQVFND